MSILNGEGIKDIIDGYESYNFMLGHGGGNFLTAHGSFFYNNDEEDALNLENTTNFYDYAALKDIQIYEYRFDNMWNISEDEGENEDELPDSNMIIGTDDVDNLHGTNENDLIYALDGDDILYGEKGDDILNGGEGDDVLYADKGDDILNGGDGDDVLYSDKGADILNGGSGDDVLYGDKGDDILNGGAGADVMYGDKGADKFIYSLETDSISYSYDTITDFTQGEDILQFEDEVFGADWTAFSGSEIAGETVITHATLTDFELHLTGVYTLVETDFDFV